MSYDVTIQAFAAPRPIAVVRRLATRQELAKVVPEACGIVWSALRAQHITGAGRHVSIYLDDKINLKVGVELDTPFAGVGEVVASSLPAGTVATVAHLGPYPQLKAAHQAIRDWCKANGHSPTGVNWEIYGHWEPAWNNDPSKIRTDVFYLLGSPPQFLSRIDNWTLTTRAWVELLS